MLTGSVRERVDESGLTITAGFANQRSTIPDLSLHPIRPSPFARRNSASCSLSHSFHMTHPHPKPDPPLSHTQTKPETRTRSGTSYVFPRQLHAVRSRPTATCAAAASCSTHISHFGSSRNGTFVTPMPFPLEPDEDD